MRDRGERESKSESDERIDGETSTGDPRREKEREGTSERFGKLSRGEREKEKESSRGNGTEGLAES